MKLLVKLAVVVLVLIVIGVVALLFYVDSIAKTAIERGGTRAMGVQTTLESADIGILSGEFALTGLNVANPSGFDTPHFLHLDEGGVGLELASLREDVIELPQLALTGIDLNLQRAGGSSNYQVILDSLKKLESGEDRGDTSGEGKKFVIRIVEIRDVNVHVGLSPLGGEATRINVPIEEIVLKDVGAGGAGIELAELTSIIVKAVISATIENGGGLIPADMLGDLSSQFAQLDDIGAEMVTKISDNLGDLSSVTEGLGDKIDGSGGDVGDAIQQGLGGLLGGDKKTDE